MSEDINKEVDPPAVRRTALMWISFIYTQANRLEDAVDEYNTMVLDRNFIETFEARGKPKEWAAQARAARRSLKKRKPPAVGADKYFFLLSVAQLIKCVRLLPNDGLPEFDDSQLMRDLRNIEEHWEQPTGRSLTRVQKSIPDIAPGRVTFTKKDIWFEGISFVDVLRWTRTVEVKLRSMERLDDAHPLDPAASPDYPHGGRALWAIMTGQLQ